MQIISGTSEFELTGPCAVVIGKFDGLHRGHRLLLEQILDAKKEGLKSVVFTFDPSPAAFFSKKVVKGLTTREEKRRFFRQLAVDVLVEFPLNERTASTAPEQFITEILQKRMHAALVVAGSDLSFGDGGRGDCALLKRFEKQCGYRVRILDKVYEDKEAISSTRVRAAVEAGRMEEACRLLGSPYAVMGPVLHGRRIGRTLGFPTVNQMPPADKLLPPNGVYFSEVECCHGIFVGVTNVGTKPTVEKGMDPPVLVETYLYDFEQDIYDTFITVRLLHFHRPEQKFEGLEALRAQLERDVEAGREYKACQFDKFTVE